MAVKRYALREAERLFLARFPAYKNFMIDEREIWARAGEFINEHGSVAWFAAALRADELLEQGEMEGHRDVLLILDRIARFEAPNLGGVTH